MNGFDDFDTQIQSDELTPEFGYEDLTPEELEELDAWFTSTEPDWEKVEEQEEFTFPEWWGEPDSVDNLTKFRNIFGDR